MCNIISQTLQMVVLLIVGHTGTVEILSQSPARQPKANVEQFIGKRDTKKDHDGSIAQKEAIDVILDLGGTFLFDYHFPNPDKPDTFSPYAININPKIFHPVVMVKLSGRKVKDDDLKFLSKLPHLIFLDLSETEITSAGMKHIRCLKKLRCLELEKTQIDDKGLEQIKGLTKMYQLNLESTNVTDAGLKYLEGMTEMRSWLGLSNTKVTDKGLKHLEGFTKLRSMTLGNIPLTWAGIDKLRSALPNTSILADKVR